MEVTAKALHVCLVIYLFPSSCFLHQCYSFLHSNTHATDNFVHQRKVDVPNVPCSPIRLICLHSLWVIVNFMRWHGKTKTKVTKKN